MSEDPNITLDRLLQKKYREFKLNLLRSVSLTALYVGVTTRQQERIAQYKKFITSDNYTM